VLNAQGYCKLCVLSMRLLKLLSERALKWSGHSLIQKYRIWAACPPLRTHDTMGIGIRSLASDSSISAPSRLRTALRMIQKCTLQIASA
jgi:hypothetical protein